MAKLFLTEGTRLGVLAPEWGRLLSKVGGGSREWLFQGKRGYPWVVKYLSLCLCFSVSPSHSASSSGILLILLSLTLPPNHLPSS